MNTVKRTLKAELLLLLEAYAKDPPMVEFGNNGIAMLQFDDLSEDILMSARLRLAASDFSLLLYGVANNNSQEEFREYFIAELKNYI